MQTLFNRIIKISIYLLVFLLPLFLLPFSFEAYEFNKQYLLFFLVSLAFFSWIAKMVLVDKEIRFKKTPLDILVVAFIFIAVLSVIFSVDKGSSLFGFYGRFSNGLIGLISLGVLYFLITNNTRIDTDKKRMDTDTRIRESVEISHKSVSISGMLKAFMWSVFFVILFSYFSIFGVWAKLNNQLSVISDKLSISLPQVILQPTFNPVAGSMEGLAIFLAVVIVLLVGRILLGAKGKLSSIINYLLLMASLGLLVIIDFQASWIVLLVTMALFLALAIGKRMFRENVNKLLLPIFLMIIAIAFLFIELNLLNLPQEQVLAQKESWQIGFRGAIENIKSGFLGSGIGTFHYDFAKFKSLEFNQTLLWQIRFDRAGNYISEIFGTMGFLGLISYIALIGFFLMVSWFILAATKKGELFSGLPLLMAFLALIIAQFFYYQNTILAFTFWLVFGLSVVSWQPPTKTWWGAEKVISFKAFPEISLIATAFLIILGLLILGCYFFTARFYLADMKYIGGLGQVGDERLDSLAKATKFNPLCPQYKIILARTYLYEVLDEMAKPAPDQIVLSQNTQLAIAVAKEASERSPNLVAGWETLGMIYREIRGIATGALEWGIKSFEKAITLEPTNPVLYTELGKLYLASDDVSRARENFARAISLKGDYIDALIQEILILESEGNLPEAISKMENLAITYPLNIEVAFQLGRLYFNGGRIDDAISQLEGVVAFFPNHSNALYSLGIAYQAKGEKEKAIRVFERVLELNPGNQDIIQKLGELKKEEVKEEVKKEK